jgi:hypothetical protein
MPPTGPVLPSVFIRDRLKKLCPSLRLYQISGCFSSNGFRMLLRLPIERQSRSRLESSPSIRFCRVAVCLGGG